MPRLDNAKNQIERSQIHLRLSYEKMSTKESKMKQKAMW